MTFSDACLALVKEFEGCKLDAYEDLAGVWTIGYGHTGPEVSEGVSWTQEEADTELQADLNLHCLQMNRCVTVPLTQGQTDALTSFVFNMGVGKFKESSLLSLLNQGQYNQVPGQLYHVDVDGQQHGWIYGGGKIQPGLVRRRQAEIALWEQAA